MTPRDDVQTLGRLADGALVPLGRVAWESHPDGRGGGAEQVGMPGVRLAVRSPLWGLLG